MLYNDEQARQSEERFQQHLHAARTVNKKELEIIVRNIKDIEDIIQKLNAIPEKTPGDIEIVNSLLLSLKPLLQKMQDLNNVLAESCLRQANAYYENVKQLAKEGNEDAKKVYEELSVFYKEMLKTGHDNSLQ